MAYFLHDYHGHPYALRDAADAAEKFDGQAATVMPHGGCGQSIRIHSDDEAVMHINVDVDASMASVQWLPDGRYAVEMDPTAGLSVYASPDEGLRDMPASVARISAATTRTVVTDYVRTGTRPTAVRWLAI